MFGLIKINFYRLKGEEGLERCLLHLSSSKREVKLWEGKTIWTEDCRRRRQRHKNVEGSREDCRKTKEPSKQSWSASTTIRLLESNFRNVDNVVVVMTPFLTTFVQCRCLKDVWTSFVQSRFWAADCPLFCLPCWTTLQRPGWLKRSCPSHAIELQTNFKFFQFFGFFFFFLYFNFSFGRFFSLLVDREKEQQKLDEQLVLFKL